MNEYPNIPSTPLAQLSNKQAKEIHFINEREEIPLTFKDFTKTYSWPNMGSLRKMAYESQSNGLATAFVKFRKRRLVLPQTLFKLLKGEEAKGNQQLAKQL
ncbi:MAG: hypothetical protein K940chlam9_00335 [Chlamydiae bacterium]|nr:hypothetical protein [Chlamydiota bacterium]